MKVIGIGTGRCGTTSLARLLDAQGTALESVTHERLEWRVTWEAHPKWLRRLDQQGGGDVALNWLPYIEMMIRRWGEDLRVICLQRGREATVESYLRKMPQRNPWQDSSYRWAPCYPTYSQDLTKREAIGRYWDEYYARAEELATRHDQVRIFQTETLNDREGQRDLLRFAGVPEGKERLRVGIRENEST